MHYQQDNVELRGERAGRKARRDMDRSLALNLDERGKELLEACSEHDKKWSSPEKRRKGRLAKPVTLAERLLYAAFSFLCQAENRLRWLARRPFISKFLQRMLEKSAPVRSLVEVRSEHGDRESQADGTGAFALTVLFTFESEDFVRGLLPRGMELFHPPFAPEGKHPLIVGFGLQYGVRPIWRRKHKGTKYHETMIGVPWVQLADSFGEPKGPFLCLPRLLLDQLAPTMLGWLFGYKKRWMRIAAEPQSFKVSSLLFKRPILEATVEYSDPPAIATDIHELTPWRESLEQPIISRAWWGGLQCTHFHWAWPLTTVSPAVVNVKAFQDNVVGLRQGEYRYGQVRHKKHNFRHKTAGTGKAYVMNVPWRLLLPFDRSVLKDSGPGNMAPDIPAH